MNPKFPDREVPLGKRSRPGPVFARSNETSSSSSAQREREREREKKREEEEEEREAKKETHHRYSPASSFGTDNERC